MSQMQNFARIMDMLFQDKYNLSVEQKEKIKSINPLQQGFLLTLPKNLEAGFEGQKVNLITRINSFGTNQPLIMSDVCEYDTMGDLSRNFYFYRSQNILKVGKALGLITHIEHDQSNRANVTYKLVNDSLVRMLHRVQKI